MPENKIYELSDRAKQQVFDVVIEALAQEAVKLAVEKIVEEYLARDSEVAASSKEPGEDILFPCFEHIPNKWTDANYIYVTSQNRLFKWDEQEGCYVVLL